MGKNKSPAFQFYVKDWLSSTKILMMTPEQEGAYIHLLAYCWDDEHCSIPDDDYLLAVMSRLYGRWFEGGSKEILKCFIKHPTKEGRLTNDRLLQEREKQRIWREKCIKGGLKSGLARQSKGSSRVVEGYLNSSSSSSSSSSSARSKICDPLNISDNKKIRVFNKPKGAKKKFALPEFVAQEIWDAYVAFRKQIRKPLTDHAMNLAIKKLTDLNANGHKPKEVINQSILNGWVGLFEIKKQAGAAHEQRNEKQKPETQRERHWRETREALGIDSEGGVTIQDRGSSPLD